ncbi:GNAT family acetyltransferase [Paenibacillus bovis]|uniref:GNAT family acetyltransferase n=1 Tax=Paenibacillus bovis TaxID=1616788 RepID=A0A172ZBM8_9BACL|nr:GNAT family acetyltransferase [Paenibacillus bovis]
MNTPKIIINLPLEPHEVPDLRQHIGWDRRDSDYPVLLERCLFYAGSRDDQGLLIAFAYICGMGLQHGYLEDVMVHPSMQGKGIGQQLVQRLLAYSVQKGVEIVTATFAEEHASFYRKCGFVTGNGGVWRKE